LSLFFGIAVLGSWIWLGQWMAEINYFLGFKLMRSAQIPKAIHYLEKSRDWHKWEVNNDYELGNAYVRSDRLNEALEAYHLALQANAGYDEVYYNLATVLAQKMGRMDEAVPYYRMAIWIQPFSREAHAGLAAVYLQHPQSKTEEGAHVLERAVQFFPKDKDFWNNLGYFYTIRGESAKALEAYSRALALDLRFELAEKNLRAILQRTGRSSHPLLEAAAAFRELQNRVARKDFSGAALGLADKILKESSYPLARLYRANLYVMNGRADEALQDFRACLQEEPDNLTVLQNMGILYRRMGRRKEAFQTFRRMLEISPHHAFAEAQIREISAQ